MWVVCLCMPVWYFCCIQLMCIRIFMCVYCMCMLICLCVRVRVSVCVCVCVNMCICEFRGACVCEHVAGCSCLYNEWRHESKWMSNLSFAGEWVQSSGTPFHWVNGLFYLAALLSFIKALDSGSLLMRSRMWLLANEVKDVWMLLEMIPRSPG